MANILVTGGLGKLGQPLLAELLQRGWRVRALCLPREKTPPGLDSRVEIIPGDVTDPESLVSACQGMQVVLHLAGILQAKRSRDFHCVNAQGTRHMLSASEAAGVRHFLFISSISVTYPELSPYAASKAAAEEAVKEAVKGASMAWTVVRPTLIYDDEGGSLEFAALVRYTAQYPWLPLPGGGRAEKRPLHASDAAMALAELAGNPRAFGKTYALAGGETLSLASMIGRIASGLELKRRILPIAKPLAFAAAALADRFKPGGSVGRQGLLGLLQPAAPDIADLQKDIAYAPRAFRPKPEALRMAAGRGKNRR